MKDKRIENLIKNDGIFMASDSPKYQYFIVKGSRRIYEVIFSKETEQYTCPCKNIRLTPCYHIKAVQRFQEEHNNVLGN